jgi:hypothetical protein
VRELHNFASLLVTGSPNTVEMLFVRPSDDCFGADEWWKLAEMRERFVTKRFLSNHLGWAMAACHTVRKKREQHLRRKGVAHALRIVDEARRIITEDDCRGPRLVIPDGPLRDEILAVKRGERDADIEAIAERTLAEVARLEAIVPSLTRFPETVSDDTVAALNAWVYATRLNSAGVITTAL